MDTVTVTQAASILGVTVKTLQRWEREGLLIPLSRTQTNRRVYSLAQLRAFQHLTVTGEPLPQEVPSA